MALKRTVEPACHPVTLAQAKAQCRVDGSDEDAVFTGLIGAATSWVERKIGRSLITQEWRYTRDSFPRYLLCLPMPPLQADASEDVTITYYDTNGTSTTLDDAEYTVDADSEPARIEPETSWPATEERIAAVTVTYTAGYGNSPEDVPMPIRQAILLLVGHWYQNREDVVTGTITGQLENSVDALLAAYWTGEYV